MKITKNQLRRLIESAIKESDEKDMGKEWAYTIRDGDTLSALHIARGAPGATLQDQIKLNQEKTENSENFNPDKLAIGQTIYLYVDSSVPAGG